MDLRKVKKLIELAEEAGIAELEVTSGDESVRISMTPRSIAGAAAPQVMTSAPLEAPSAGAGPVGAPEPAPEGKPVPAPMAGTFYRAPSPEAEPFVEIGQTVSAGDVLCIIESMKMMHEIRAAEGGSVTAIPVANGTPISTGEVLFILS